MSVAKAKFVDGLTPARALIAELVRSYSILGIDCFLPEIHELAYFLQREIEALKIAPSLNWRFQLDRYGPCAPSLSHLVNSLHGSYLHFREKPIGPIRFADERRDLIAAYLTGPQAKAYRPALDRTIELIDGFESPLGMELLATVDWLVSYEGAIPSVDGIVEGLRGWPMGGAGAVERKLRLFDRRIIKLALDRLHPRRR